MDRRLWKKNKVANYGQVSGMKGPIFAGLAIIIITIFSFLLS